MNNFEANTVDYRAARLRDAFIDEDIAEVSIEEFGSEYSITSPGINNLQIAFTGNELVIDLIESDSLAGGAQKNIEVLKRFAKDNDYIVRASGVVTEEAKKFWSRLDFKKEGNDYVLEQ